MKELLRSSDPVRLSWLEVLLAGAGIGTVLLDANASAVWIGAIERRLMVADDDFDPARRLLHEAGEL